MTLQQNSFKTVSKLFQNGFVSVWCRRSGSFTGGERWKMEAEALNRAEGG